MNRLRTPAGALLASILLLGALFVAFLAVKTAALQILPPQSPVIAVIAPHSVQPTLDRAMIEFETRGGKVDPTTVAAVEATSEGAPLEATPYLLAGVQELLAHRDDRALAAFEAGRRLDPRDRWLNVLLLDRYLRLHRYDDAVDEFAVLSRLVGPANAPIASMLAQMATDPATRGPVRETLRRDPQLELSVLGALSSSGVPPALVMTMASPHAWSVAGAAGGWGATLVQRLVDQGQFATARQVWLRVYRVSPAAGADQIFDRGLTGIVAGPPFGWALAGGSIGGVDIRHNQLSIDYYGRDTGELASQLLLLDPGRYRFTSRLSGSADQGATPLHWSLACAGDDKSPALADLALPTPRAAVRAVTVDFVVPAGCPAQWLRLSGVAGEFPTPVNASIDSLSLQPVGASS